MTSDEQTIPITAEEAKIASAENSTVVQYILWKDLWNNIRKATQLSRYEITVEAIDMPNSAEEYLVKTYHYKVNRFKRAFGSKLLYHISWS